jgi:hypothetical protein
MRIRIDPHTLERAAERGADAAEIEDVIQTGSAVAARGRRFGKAKVYPFGRERHGRYYDQKRVEVYYVAEGEDIVTVTVYVFYGQWK